MITIAFAKRVIIPKALDGSINKKHNTLTIKLCGLLLSNPMRPKERKKPTIDHNVEPSDTKNITTTANT